MATKKFKCTVCGYIHEGDAAPEKCPVCMAPASAFVELKDEKKKGLFSDKNGNAYIIMYSTVMVVIVATLLAVAALSLQSRQYANELNEKKQSILSSLSAQGENYDAFIKGYVLDADGNELEGEDVFELLKDLQGAFDDGKFPVFEAADGRVVIPVTGMGLWGPVWAISPSKRIWTPWPVSSWPTRARPPVWAPRSQRRNIRRSSSARRSSKATSSSP